MTQSMLAIMNAPEFQEVFMCRLTTPTTCYSTPRHVEIDIDHDGASEEGPSSSSSSSSWTARLATENHVLDMHIVGGASSKNTDHTNRDDGEGLPVESGEKKEEDKDLDEIMHDDSVLCQEHPIMQTIAAVGIPRKIAKKLICVGYSSSQPQRQAGPGGGGEEGQGEEEAESLWEVMVLLDTRKSQQESSQAGNANAGNTTATTNDDEASVATSKTSLTSATSAAGTTATTTATNKTAANKPSSVRRTKSDGAASTGSGTSSTPAAAKKLADLVEELDGMEQREEEEEEDQELSQPVARLLLYNRQKSKYFLKGLDFRPLSPCVQVVSPQTTSDDTNNSEQVVVWVGSADDSKIRLFRPPGDDSSDVLVEISLGEKKATAASCGGDNQKKKCHPFSFDSPVMAIDSLALPPQPGTTNPTTAENVGATENETNQQPDDKVDVHHDNILAVACQDGIIRMIGYTVSAEYALQSREEYTVTVDGPIISISLHFKRETGTVEAIFGSLCGYVARFLKQIHLEPLVDVSTDGTTSSNYDRSRLVGKWRGPFMVAEGFFMHGEVQEDSVLSVHAWEGKVAVGTYSGRCLLYGPFSENEADDYGQPFWDCQLSDAIHGICILPTTKSSMLLLVTTRKSIHLFQEIPRYYYPDMAQRKLELLWSRRRPYLVLSTPPALESTPSSPVLEAEDKPVAPAQLPGDAAAAADVVAAAAAVSPTSEQNEESQKQD